MGSMVGARAPGPGPTRSRARACVHGGRGCSPGAPSGLPARGWGALSSTVASSPCRSLPPRPGPEHPRDERRGDETLQVGGGHHRRDAWPQEPGGPYLSSCRGEPRLGPRCPGVPGLGAPAREGSPQQKARSQALGWRRGARLSFPSAPPPVLQPAGFSQARQQSPTRICSPDASCRVGDQARPRLTPPSAESPAPEQPPGRHLPGGAGFWSPPAPWSRRLGEGVQGELESRGGGLSGEVEVQEGDLEERTPGRVLWVG